MLVHIEIDHSSRGYKNTEVLSFALSKFLSVGLTQIFLELLRSPSGCGAALVSDRCLTFLGSVVVSKVRTPITQ
jgi:hypothetical protein